MATIGGGRNVVGLLAMVLAAAGCGGGGSGASATGDGAGAAALAPTRDDSPFLFVGACYICDSARVGAQATLDGESVSALMIDTDAVVIARGTDTITTTTDGRRFSSTALNEIQARSAVVGRIEWIDPARGRIGVLGQDLHGIGPWVGAVVESPPGMGAGASLAIAQLAVGQRVRAFGFDTDDGPIAATGVHAAVANGADRVTGRVTRIDLAARLLVIGSLSIDYSVAGLEGFPDGAVQVGDRIEAVGTATDEPRRLRATNLLYRGSPLAIAAGTRVRALGVGAAPSRTRSPSVPPASTMRLGGEILRLGPSCTRAPFSPDSYATITARADTSGALQSAGDTASPCQLRVTHPSAAAYVTGPLALQDAAGGGLGVLDVVMQAQAGTSWFEAANLAGDVATFRDDDPVTIGLWQGVGPARGVAAWVQRADTPVEPPALARFEGWMSSPGPGLVTFLGRSIRIDAQTLAGFRSCNVPFVQPLTPVAPESFVALAYTTPSRWITASVTATDAGEWRAVTIETWDSIYCD